MNLIDFPSTVDWGEPVHVLSEVRTPFLKPQDAAVALNCTVKDLEVRWQAGEVERIRVATMARYRLLRRGASESNAPEAGRSRKAGSAGHRTYSDRREYMREYQRAWVAERR